jgi:hypothetical protein
MTRASMEPDFYGHLAAEHCGTHSPQRLYPHATDHGVAGLFPPSDIGSPENSHDADKALRPPVALGLKIIRGVKCQPATLLSK